ncbi:hypothetical protein [Prosthecobacter dejongeii]|uniref:YD repeat-containing protein n=1 Tax=Prosthecobacter dejongeii TaxID=48465 RepID=A0A7W7YM37_9BACT|nr:hypothetical protein [Prosthecobacter dejongeii]MBB5038695.1 hypothetical protein [Prosthecobacter dejongeii]
MKALFTHSLKAGLLAATLLTSSSLLAQVQRVETVTATSSEGVINEFGPQSIIIRSSTGAAPSRYTFRETTTYVDEYGNPVSTSVVKSGLPVTVYYSQEGDAMVASKVVVRGINTPSAAAAVETSQTTTTGVINTYGPEGLVVRTETSADPLRYTFSKTTTYVDENGQPVSIETVKSGLPVTVYYTRNGDSLVANKVIVRRSAAVVPAPEPTVEKRTTTTTRSTIIKGDD